MVQMPGAKAARREGGAAEASRDGLDGCIRGLIVIRVRGQRTLIGVVLAGRLVRSGPLTVGGTGNLKYVETFPLVEVPID